jgi:hypothetical protein
VITVLELVSVGLTVFARITFPAPEGASLGGPLRGAPLDCGQGVVSADGVDDAEPADVDELPEEHAVMPSPRSAIPAIAPIALRAAM